MAETGISPLGNASSGLILSFMKTSRSLSLAISMFALAGTAFATDPASANPIPDVSGAMVNDPAALAISRQCRASDLRGARVVSASSGQKLGAVRDLIVDVNTGRISFAVLATEKGDRKVAVPVSLLRPRSDEKEFALSRAADKLSSAPDFAKNDLEDKTWAAQTEDYFSSQPTQEYPKPAAGQVISEAAGAQPGHLARASDLTGMPVKDSDGNTVGEIKDVVIDWPAAQVVYAVLDSTGVAGLSGQYIAIPLQKLARSSAGGTLTASLTKESLSVAPSFAAAHWPAPQDAAFIAKVNHFYHDTPKGGQ